MIVKVVAVAIGVMVVLPTDKVVAWHELRWVIPYVRRSELGPGVGAVGIRMTTDGVVVAGGSEVETPNGKRSPAAEAGLKKGDVISRLGGADIGTAQDFKTALAQLDGSKTTETIERGGKAKQLNITPAQDADGARKHGLWLRDGESGVGPLTIFLSLPLVGSVVVTSPQDLVSMIVA